MTNARDLLPERDRRWFDVVAANLSIFGLEVIEPPAPKEAPIPFVPLMASARRSYGMLLDCTSAGVWSGQMSEMVEYYGDSGYVGSESVGFYGLLVSLYLTKSLGDDAAALIESLSGVPLPRESEGPIDRKTRKAARAAHGWHSPTSVLVRSHDDFFLDPELMARILELAPHDGEVWVEVLHRETQLGHVDAAVEALRKLEATWKHTWGCTGVDVVPDAIKALGLPDDGTSRLVFEAYHPDFGERFRRALELIAAKDWHGGTKWIHDLAYEEGDFHSVLPLLARGFKRMGWDWAVELCRQRRPTDAEKARWPFDMAEALKD